MSAPVKPRASWLPQLAGRRVLITGAAADGVGRQLAIVLGAHGATVLLADISPLDETAAAATAAGAPRVVQLRFNAGVEGDSARMVREGVDAVGGLDFLILNHNLGCFSGMIDAPDVVGTARRLMSINFFSYAETADAAFQPLLESARARGGSAKSGILAISSLAAAMPMLNTHGYAASKAAISKWFECMRLELRGHPHGNLLSVSLMYFSAVKTQTLLNALGGEGGPNKGVLALAAEPRDAAWATIDAMLKRTPNAYFPANVGVLPRIYSCWPWLARRIVSSVPVASVAPPAAKPAAPALEARAAIADARA